MNRKILYRSAALVALAALVGCNDATTTAAETKTAAPESAPAHATAPQAPAAKKAAITGTVTETMNSGGYTYVQVDTGSEKVWAAGPQFAAEVGSEVTVNAPMPMPGYHSKTLDRTFDQLYFSPAITPAGAPAPTKAAPHGAVGSAPEASVDLSGIQKAEGGMTVAELFADQGKLAGKEVAVRGKVVKYNAGIMGKNWIHLRDGTGADGTNDLTVTTQATAAVGDTVLVRGAPTLDKDFGFGYHYDLILEDAQVTVE